MIKRYVIIEFCLFFQILCNKIGGRTKKRWKWYWDEKPSTKRTAAPCNRLREQPIKREAANGGEDVNVSECVQRWFFRWGGGIEHIVELVIRAQKTRTKQIAHPEEWKSDYNMIRNSIVERIYLVIVT